MQKGGKDGWVWQKERLVGDRQELAVLTRALTRKNSELGSSAVQLASKLNTLAQHLKRLGTRLS